MDADTGLRTLTPSNFERVARLKAVSAEDNVFRQNLLAQMKAATLTT